MGGGDEEMGGGVFDQSMEGRMALDTKQPQYQSLTQMLSNAQRGGEGGCGNGDGELG